MILDKTENNAEVTSNSFEYNKLKESFPQYFEKDGSFNFEEFKNSLSNNNITFSKESYALNFLGKQYARLQTGISSETMIVPDVKHNSLEENKNSENIYIKGDNLEALRHMLHSYLGKIKMIYIDPPYNTGSDDFAYPDKFEYSKKDLIEKMGLEEEEAVRIYNLAGKASHSAWLTFMFPRLSLARELLSEDGVIFISIDDNEQANLKLLCDAIFGAESFITTLHVELSATQGMKVKAAKEGNIVKNAEYVLIYSKNDKKNIAKTRLYDFRPEYDNHYSKYLDDMNRVHNLKDVYNKTVEKERQVRDIVKAYSQDLSFQEFVHSNIHKIFRYDKVTGFDYNDFQENQVVYIEKNNRSYNLERIKNTVNQLMFLSDSFGQCDDFKQSYGLRKIRGDWWKEFYKDMGNVSKEGDMAFNNGKKPVRLIQQLLKLCVSEDSLVLDFFSGSATTAHAVMQHNVQANAKLKYIMVQIEEPTKIDSEARDDGYNTICDIGIERIKRAAKKIKEDSSADIDYGFKVYTLKTVEDKSLDKCISFKDSPQRTMLHNEYVDLFKFNNINGAETILQTWKVQDGYGFTAKHKDIDLVGYSAYLCEDTIYLIHSDISTKSLMALCEKLEAKCTQVNQIVIYGYSFTLAKLQELEKNLKQLERKISLSKRF